LEGKYYTAEAFLMRPIGTLEHRRNKAQGCGRGEPSYPFQFEWLKLTEKRGLTHQRNWKGKKFKKKEPPSLRGPRPEKAWGKGQVGKKSVQGGGKMLWGTARFKSNQES